MNIITTREDLRTYLHDARADLTALGDRYTEAVLDQIAHSDHPEWGKDWGAWLAVELDALIAETLRGLDALGGENAEPKLEGSDKQVAWAEKVRARFATVTKAAARAVREGRYGYVSERFREQLTAYVEQRRAEVLGWTRAGAWIDNRGHLDTERAFVSTCAKEFALKGGK